MARTATEIALLENQRAFLARLLETEGWKIYEAAWTKMLREVAEQLRAKDNSNRDFDAGVVSGYERMLTWPAKRIAALDRMIKGTDGE